MPVVREQADALAIADNDQAEAVMLDFVNPFRRRRHLGATGQDGGLKTHAVEICIAEQYFECIGRGHIAATRAYPQEGAKMRSR